MTGTLEATYKVAAGAVPLNPSTISFNQIQTYSGPAEGSITGTVTGGSFFSLNSFLDIYPKKGAAGCAAKWSPGVTSSYEVG